MRFLCTNDDGILAHGLDCLVRAAEQIGEVTVVAPDREQSATSHSLTLHHPLRPVRRGEHRYQVDGTPTDCVMLAVEALMEQRPDFVLSGINHGQNMGEDVLYSGTVSAAMEGLALGIPSIALSFAGGDLRADIAKLDEQVEILVPLLRHLTSLPVFPAGTLLNVNLPPVRADEVRGIKLTRLGRRVYSNSIQP
ncbi:MAG: 5'/3'-nucleotidase SurE, partial [Gemmatimonadota bacterium]